MAIFEEEITDFLYPRETILSNQYVIVFHDEDIQFYEYYDSNAIGASYGDHVLLTEVISYHFGIKNLSLSDTIVFDQVAHKTYPIHIVDRLELDSLVGFYYVIEYYQDDLSLTESIICRKIINAIHVSDDIILEDSLGFYNFQKNPISFNSGHCPSELPTVFLYDNISTIVTLKSPSFGNQISHSMGRIQNRTRGNELIIYNDSSPSSMDFILQFDTLLKSTIDSLKLFIRKNFGKPVLFSDHNGNDLFAGIIMSPEFKIVEERNNCSYKTELVFRVFS